MLEKKLKTNSEKVYILRGGGRGVKANLEKAYIFIFFYFFGRLPLDSSNILQYISYIQYIEYMKYI